MVTRSPERGGPNVELHCGWSISFQQYVHMYCHRLTATKGGKHVNIPCEDTPAGFLGVWPQGLQLEEPALHELLKALRDWADSSGRVYRIYTSTDEYVTNDASGIGEGLV